MLNQNYRFLLPVQIFDYFEYILRTLRVELRCRFVYNNNIRVLNNDGSQSDSLSLSAGQLTGMLEHKSFDLEQAYDVHYFGYDLFTVNSHIFKTEGNLFKNSFFYSAVLSKGVLENEAYSFGLFFFADLFCAFSEYFNRPFNLSAVKRRNKAADDIANRCFAAAVRADNRTYLSLRNGKRNVLQAVFVGRWVFV